MFLTILVNKFLVIYIKDTIPLFLRMVKRGLANPIRSKVTRKRVFSNCACKISFSVKKNRMTLKVYQLKSKLLIWKSIIKSSEIYLIQTKKTRSKFNQLELQCLYQEWTPYYANLMMKCSRCFKMEKRLE